MKITIKHLQNLINEEIDKILQEGTVQALSIGISNIEITPVERKSLEAELARFMDEVGKAEGKFAMLQMAEDGSLAVDIQLMDWPGGEPIKNWEFGNRLETLNNVLYRAQPSRFAVKALELYERKFWPDGTVAGNDESGPISGATFRVNRYDPSGAGQKIYGPIRIPIIPLGEAGTVPSGDDYRRKGVVDPQQHGQRLPHGGEKY